MKNSNIKKISFSIIFTISIFVLWSFKSFLIFAPIEEPKNPSIFIDGENQIGCKDIESNEVQEFKLEVEYTNAFSTESYEVTSIPYSPAIPFESVEKVSEKLNFNNDDEFATKPITFFPFGFLEKTGNQVAVGENGVISFDASQSGLYNLNYPEDNIPSQKLQRNSIFASHTDLVFDHSDDNSGVFYSIIGGFPARKLVVTYLNATIFDCGVNNKVNVQVILEETTNAIRVFVREKDNNCGVIVENTVIGIQNSDGNLGYNAPNRNYSDGNWSAYQEAWEFRPNGAKGPEINWYEGDYDASKSSLGNTNDITVNSSPSNLYYTVRITYPNGVVLTDEIRISEFYPKTKEKLKINVCSSIINLSNYANDFSLVDPANFDIKYYTNSLLTNEITSPENFNLYSNTTVVYAKVMNKKDNSCYDFSELTLYKNYYPVPSEIFVCDAGADNIELNYDVSLFNDVIFESTPGNEIRYYDSETSTSPIENLDIKPGTQIWLEIVNEGCISSKLGPITLDFAPIPGIKTPPTNIDITICDKQFNYTEPLKDFGSWKDLLLDNGLILNNINDEVKLYSSIKDAINNTNEITEIKFNRKNKTYNKTNNSINDTYFIRIENDYGCFSIIPLPIKIRFFGVNAKAINNNVCVSDQPIDVDLSCLMPKMIIEMYDEYGNHNTNTSSIINDIKITYHASGSDANKGINEINPNQKVDVSLPGNNTFYVRFEICSSCDDGKPCYTVKPITFKTLNTQPINRELEVCRTTDKVQKVDNLKLFNSQLVDNIYSYIIRYYKTEDDAINNTNAINSYNFTGNDDLWVKIINKTKSSTSSCYNSTGSDYCQGIYKIKFVFGAKIEPIELPPIAYNDICDNNADLKESFDLTQLEKDLYNGNAKFTYYTKFNSKNYILGGRINNPQNFIIVGNPEVSTSSASDKIYVKIEYEDNACFQIVTLDITLNFKNSIITNKGYLCDCLPSPGLYSNFNLTDAIKLMFDSEANKGENDFSNMDISYYEKFSDAENETKNILKPEDFNSSKEIQTIYVKFKNKKTNCYTIEELDVKNLIKPVPIGGDSEYCDSNFNGRAEVIFSDLNQVVMPNNTNKYYYNYFLTEEDALNNTNPILKNYDPYAETNSIEDYFYEFETDVTPEYIYVTVDADNNTCPADEVTGKFICSGYNRVKLKPSNQISITKTTFTLPAICDNFNDTGLIGEPTYNDGISSGIDLTVYESDVLKAINSPVTIKRLLYYKSLEDLQNDPFPYGSKVIPDNELKNFTNIDENGNPVETVFLKIETYEKGWCPTLFEIKTNVKPGPSIAPQPNYYLCPGGSTNIILNNPTNESLINYNFEWTLPDGTIITNKTELLNSTQIGKYTIKIIDKITGCETPKYNFYVSQVNPPTILELNVIDESIIEVIATGDNKFDIEYSIDGINFQDSNLFTNLTYGDYTVWARYKQNAECINTMQTILIKIHNAITPNNDGLNDCVVIDNLNVFGKENSTLIIYNRYGKVIFNKSDNQKIEWCGIYLGRNKNTTDYWYQLILPDGRKKSGHITIKNQ